MSGFTLASKVEHSLEVKQSRFLATGFPIVGIDEAMALLDIDKPPPSTPHCGASQL